MVGRCFKMLGPYRVRQYQYNYTPYFVQLIILTFFFCFGKNYAQQSLSQLWADRMCIMWAVSLRHAASDTAFRLYLLMGARGGSAVDILVVAPGTSSSVGRLG